MPSEHPCLSRRAQRATARCRRVDLNQRANSRRLVALVGVFLEQLVEDFFQGGSNVGVSFARFGSLVAACKRMSSAAREGAEKGGAPVAHSKSTAPSA